MVVNQSLDVVNGIIVQIPSIEVAIDNTTLIIDGSNKIAINLNNPNTWTQAPTIFVNSATGTFLGAISITNTTNGAGDAIAFYGANGTTGTAGLLSYNTYDSGTNVNGFALIANYGDSISGHLNSIGLLPSMTANTGLIISYTNGSSGHAVIFSTTTTATPTNYLDDGNGNFITTNGYVLAAVADSSLSGKLFLSSTNANILKFYDTQATPILHEVATLDAANIPQTALIGNIVDSLTATNGLAVSNPTGAGAASYTIVLNGSSLSNGASGLSIDLANPNTWSGIQTFSSAIVASAGIASAAGASTPITVGASPYTYTNTSASNQQIFVQGGTVSAISYNPNGVSGISLNAFTDNVLILRPNDTLTITYTAAPIVNSVQL